jgi:sulfite reductase (NADPH) flavoprotein alpha-component
MSNIPVIPETAPFTLEQRAWLNGFLAGVFSRGSVAPIAAAATAPAALQPLTILFGSQTGTAEGLAKRAAKDAGKRGFVATSMDMAAFTPAQLAQEKNVLVITSTFGEGDPPDNAKALHAALAADAARTLANLRFSVCGLGDKNYVQFCKCAQDFDAFLESRGGTRVAPRVDCDVDFEANFAAWLDTALAALARSPEVGVSSSASSSTSVGEPRSTSQPATPNPEHETETGFSKKNPFPALVLTSRNLNGTGSAKQVHHIEFSLEGSGLVYHAGDALGVRPQNCPELVTEALTALGCDGEEAVPAPDGSTTSLRRALAELYDLGRPSTELLTHFGGGGGGTAVALHQVLDVLLARVDVKLSPVDFVRSLRKLQPRLYSISSSPNAHPGQVHLTVGAVRYELAGRERKGVCSTFLADRVVPGESRVGVFVHSNKAFRLPASGDTPIVMVGPGTGIAPFRAFLQERRASAARGKNWLFFGDRRGTTDFLYRDELLAFKNDGLLTQLDLAWSRDQQEKIYVQHRLLEHAAEFFAWLEAGAHFYVCGDASRMAKDVDAALHTIVERAGGKTRDQAAAYVQSLKTTKRYARDVY